MTAGSRSTLSVTALLWLLVAAATGCTSVDQGMPTSRFAVEPGITTRDELYRAVGPPHAVHQRRDGSQVLIYSHARTQGLGVGVSILLSPFRIGSLQTELDSILIDVSRDDVVIGARQIGGDANPGWPLWPGGDGSAD